MSQRRCIVHLPCFLLLIVIPSLVISQDRDQEVYQEVHQEKGPLLVDLTHPFDQKTIYWPTEPSFRLERTALGVTEKGYFYAANRFASAEHGGTHIDAPDSFLC